MKNSEWGVENYLEFIPKPQWRGPAAAPPRAVLAAPHYRRRRLRVAQGPWLRVTPMVSFGMNIALMMVIGVATASAAERTWMRSEILAISDAEVRRRGGNPEEKAVAVAMTNEWRRSDLKVWTVLYRPLNVLTVGGELCVIIDRATGNVVETRVGE